MRILLTTISLSAERGGGTAERTRKLAKHLKLAGEYCEVATIEDGVFAKNLRDDDIKVYCTGFVRPRFTVPLISFVKLSRMVHQADVIHILGFWNLLSVATAIIATFAQKPYLLSAAGEFAALNKPRAIVKLFFVLFGKRMIRHARAILAITALEKDQIVARLHINERSIVILPNGVEEFVVSSDFKSPPLVQNYILFVGRLAEVKGPDLLIEAFGRICEKYPSTNLLIAGPDFGLERRLRELASLGPLRDRVLFLGFVNEAERSGLYRDAQFVAVPSRSEAMSLVAVEAGIAGKAVLVTDQCGLDEIRDINGGVVCAANTCSIAAGLEELLSCSDSVERGLAWKKVVTEKYTWTKISGRFIQICKQLL